MSLILNPAVCNMQKCSCCSVRMVLQVQVCILCTSKASQSGTSIQNLANNAQKSPLEHALGNFLFKADVRFVSQPLNVIFDPHEHICHLSLLVGASCFVPFCCIMGLQMTVFP